MEGTLTLIIVLTVKSFLLMIYAWMDREFPPKMKQIRRPVNSRRMQRLCDTLGNHRKTYCVVAVVTVWNGSNLKTTTVISVSAKAP